jgi:hypothetical protein
MAKIGQRRKTSGNDRYTGSRHVFREIPTMKFKNILPFALTLALLLGAGLASAQTSTPPAGEYIYEGGSGALRVKADGRFDITTLGLDAKGAPSAPTPIPAHSTAPSCAARPRLPTAAAW